MEEKTYKAFISYSHKDEKFAKWLHKSLETYKIPKSLKNKYPNIPKRIFPIFRDRDELATSSNLGEDILDAIRNSEYLIIVCSTHSAKSKWINKEIIDFKTIHGEDKVHAIIIDGEPYDKEKECFPEALKYKVINGQLSNEPVEPIAGDFREGKDGKEIGKLKLIAGLLNIEFDELYKRDEKRKRKVRLIWGAISIVLIIILSALTIFSFYQYTKAKEQTKIAQDKTKLANKQTKLAKTQAKIAKKQLIKANHNIGLALVEKANTLNSQGLIPQANLLAYKALTLLSPKQDKTDSFSKAKNIIGSR